MENLVKNARNSEIALIKKRAFLNGYISSLLQVLPRIAFFSTLLVYVFQGNTLDAELVVLKLNAGEFS